MFDSEISSFHQSSFQCFLFTDGGCVEFSEARDKSTSIAVCMKVNYFDDH